jgi:AcrR family transcriptional regulator
MNTHTHHPQLTGRRRDDAIDRRILDVARRHFALYGYESLSVTAVAHEAGTTRQALYRRWPDKAKLVDAVVSEMSDTADVVPSSSPFTDLVTELTNFQHGVSQEGRMSLVGTMLQETTSPAARATYQAQVIAPRRERIRIILQRAIDLGLLDSDSDLEIALTMCTGSWYGRALAGNAVPDEWPLRTTKLIWRALGGEAVKTSLS